MGLKEEVENEEDIEYFEYGDSENVIKLEEQHHFDNLSPGEADPKIEIKVDIVKAETDCNDLQAGQSSPVSYKYHYSPHIKNRIGNSAWNDVKHSWMLKTLSSKNCSSHVLLPQITLSQAVLSPHLTKDCSRIWTLLGKARTPTLSTFMWIISMT